LLPERLLLPPPPRDPDLARRWGSLPFEDRRRLAIAATQDDVAGGRPVPDADGGGPAHAGLDTELVGALADARVATGWRLQVAAPILGWLVLMTIWGFGRSSFPADEGGWFVAGLLTGVVAWVLAAVGARRRVQRAARVATRLRGS
jgi:hypothetical protein